jgi:hypothetical protein
MAMTSALKKITCELFDRCEPRAIKDTCTTYAFNNRDDDDDDDD